MTTTIPSTVLAPEELAGLDAYWRAANYLSVGQIYLLDNALLRRSSRPSTSSPACSATGVRRPA
jgi:xylulose-5-phosphate/fructose-6-phosphate phosphoketolase